MPQTYYLNVYWVPTRPVGHETILGLKETSKRASDKRARHPLSPRRIYRLRVHLKPTQQEQA